MAMTSPPGAALVVLLACLSGCSGSRPGTDEAPSITVLTWVPGESNNLDIRIMREFTRRTGILIRVLPASESASKRLSQEVALLEHASSAVDVFQIDTTWPGILANYMIDLKDALRTELSDDPSEVIENATVDGRIVAAPFFIEYGMLYYRTDLLKKYGFRRPPRTWDELETQSSRIQEGERRRGRSDFWGYVWQGAEYEGLTCNALEWQSSQGGGNLVEQDHTVRVDNPAAIRAFARAARWVGTISPPGVIAYLEEDSRNLWQSGRAAFLRNWSYVYPLARKSAEIGNRFSVVSLPAGVNRHASTLGGWYLAVPKTSRHRGEAIAFIKYMTSGEVQRERAIEGAFLPAIDSLYRDPAILRASPLFGAISEVPGQLVRRPSSLVGARYDLLSRAYAHEVHSILTGTVSPSEGAANIQADIERITGFGSGNQEPQ
jgi:trehalose/maltose transport system substrate-binding protein